MSRTFWHPEALVRTVEAVHLTVRDAHEDRYDGATERGPGPFSVVTPHRTASYVDDYYDRMDRLPWALDHPADLSAVTLDDDRPMETLFTKVDAYTDGALLIEGDGTVYDHTVELTPDVAVEEAYEEGWGTKTRAALNISAVDIPDSYTPETPYLQEQFPELDDPRPYRPWQDSPYGDIVAITTSSTTGTTRVFDDGAVVRKHDGVVEPRDMDAVWQRALQTDE